jgi:glycosyltransferase involved in cell wall biosynthesis
MNCPSLSELPPPPERKTGWPWNEETLPLPETMPDGSHWPRVSIVTPSYNQVQYIEETMRSVLLQGYPNLEYFVIDGGSTDGSVEIIKKYEPWLTYWVSEPDTGQSYAINKGWQRSTGEIIAWLNSDDVYMNDAIKISVEGLYTNKKSSMVYSDLLFINEINNTLTAVVAKPFDPIALLLGSTFIPQQTVFMRSQSLIAAGFLDEGLHLLMDLDLWLRIGVEQKLLITYLSGNTLAKYRWHPLSKWAMYSERGAREKLRVLDKLYGNKKLSRELRSVKAYVYGSTYFTIANLEANKFRSESTLKYLFKTLSACPSYVAKRPVNTFYLLKQAALGFLLRKPQT